MTRSHVEEIAPDVPRGLEVGLRNYWYPILQSDELPFDRPVGLKCLNEPLVAWRDQDRLPHVFTDRCPHRNAKLSLGRLLGGALQCAFHGLRFAGGGRCVLIPWEPEDSLGLADVWVTSYPARELGGYVWAYLGDVSRFPPPPLEDEVPEELLHPEEYLWFRFPTEVWETNWLVAIDGGDAFHAVTLHAETQAVAAKEWQGGRAERPTVPLVDRRIRLVEGTPSHGLRAISTDPEGNPIHHGHLFDVKGDRFALPAITTVPIRPVPAAEPYVPRLWQFPVDENRTMVVRYSCQRARTEEERQRWQQLFQDVVRPRVEAINREDAIIAASQGDLVNARATEYLFEPDAFMVTLRRQLKEAFLAQLDGRRVAPHKAGLVWAL